MLPLVVILIVLWLLGALSGYTLGGLLHLVLVVVLILVVLQVLTGRKVDL